MEDKTQTTGKKCLRVKVGYGWQKMADNEGESETYSVYRDVLWQSLRDKLECYGANFKAATGVDVCVSRLRAAHGKLVWQSILEGIAGADILVFDVGSMVEDSIVADGTSVEDILTTLNHNVLVEIGVAVGMKKPVMLLCPEKLFSAIPIDLKGYLWSLYSGKFVQKERLQFDRKMLDGPGFRGGFTAILHDVAESAGMLVENEHS